ncbi:hypothetical protein ACJ7V3_11915 [Halomonas elongata]|uniref:hypothetical protein n=1 Tax=Halomonas elongata TaxID=2746 RepID=UPI0038D419A5
MTDHKVIKGRWDGVVIFIWVLALATILLSVYQVSQFGYVEVRSVNQLGTVETQQRVNVMVVSVAIGQSIGAIVLGLLFSMIKSVYQEVIDLRFQNVKSQDKPASKGESHSSKAADAAKGRGITVGYVNDSSPLSGLVDSGHVIMLINSHEVTSVKQASDLLKSGENRVSFFDHTGHLLERPFEVRENQSIGIRTI